MPLERRSEFWTTGTHIVFRNLGNMNGSAGYQRKTNVYEVLTRGEGSAVIGEIRWFGRWRKYCFFPYANTVYEETCMREISEFIEQETRTQRVKSKVAKEMS